MSQTTNQPWIIMERKFEPFLYDTMIWHWTDIGSVSKCFVCGIRANLKAVISHLCPVLKRQVRRLPQWHLKAAMHRDASAPIPQIAQSRWFCTICVVGWPYSWKPERAWKPGDIEKKLERTASYSQSQWSWPLAHRPVAKCQNTAFPWGCLKWDLDVPRILQSQSSVEMECRAGDSRDTLVWWFHTVVPSWSACFMLSPAASLCAQPGRESSRIAEKIGITVHVKNISPGDIQ